MGLLGFIGPVRVHQIRATGATTEITPLIARIMVTTRHRAGVQQPTETVLHPQTGTIGAVMALVQAMMEQIMAVDAAVMVQLVVQAA